MENDINKIKAKIDEVWKESDALAQKYKNFNPKMEAIFNTISASCFQNNTILRLILVYNLFK